jgi:diadenosine tetraphosphate (Ap4A) HIT family hydrolase
MLPVVDPCPFCSVPADRIWIDSAHAIAFGAEVPAAEGHIVVVPREHVPSIHALPMAAQKGVWALVAGVRGRLRTGMVPDAGFSIGFDESGPHAIVHVVPRRATDEVVLPECGEWINDDGVLG